MSDGPGATYDRIGRTYASQRRPDPRWAAAIRTAIGDARSVVNIGAGAGSYEPSDVWVVAVEPSATMIAQRPPGAAPVVRGRAEALPLRDGAADVAMGVLTIHHWSDWRRGIAEMRRVAARQVLLAFDVGAVGDYWFVADYMPEASAFDRDRTPALADVAEALGGADLEVLEVPADITDGMFTAYWSRPEAYLDPAVRAGMSLFAQLPAEVTSRAVEALDADLRSGAWEGRHGALRRQATADWGYRLVVAGS